jgi:hypothetical protein
MPGSNDKLFLAFFKKFFYTFLHIFTYLNLGGKWMPAQAVVSHPEALERLPSRLLLGRRALWVTGGCEWVAAEFVLLHPEALERLPGRFLERSVCRRDLLLGVSVGVDDDGIGRRHDEFVCYILL